MFRRVIKQSEKPTLDSEATVRPHWSPQSWSGLVIRAIVQCGRPLTWREIQEATGLDKKSLNRALFELISSEDIYKIDGNANTESKYNMSEERFQSILLLLSKLPMLLVLQTAPFLRYYQHNT